MKMPRLVPQANQFNDLLGALSAQACASAQNLKIFITAGNEAERDKAGTAITNARTSSKELSMNVTQELCRSFITPFDREDIHELAENLYKIPKMIEKIKGRIILHKMLSQPEDFSPQVDIIVDEASAMEEIMHSLLKGDNNKKILDKIAILRDLENKGDDVRNQLLTALFSSQCEIRDLLLRRDIHDMLEKVVDRFRDAANVAFEIVLKNS